MNSKSESGRLQDDKVGLNIRYSITSLLVVSWPYIYDLPIRWAEGQQHPLPPPSCPIENFHHRDHALENLPFSEDYRIRSPILMTKYRQILTSSPAFVESWVVYLRCFLILGVVDNKIWESGATLISSASRSRKRGASLGIRILPCNWWAVPNDPSEAFDNRDIK